MELSVETILAALDGDENAMLSVCKHYERYINSFAYEEYFDEYGNARVRFDPDTKQQLQEKLLVAIKKFDIERAKKDGMQ